MTLCSHWKTCKHKQCIAARKASQPDSTRARSLDDLALMLPTPAEPPNGTYETKDRGYAGKQMLASYANGYGASVIQGPYSYGGPEGKYELAVEHGADHTTAELCYATPITSDVIGWLSPERVVEILHQIAALPRNDACDHEKADDWWEHDDEGRASVGDALGSMLDMVTKGDF